jgi:tetratricopeptide (TPR) repeat protein
LTEAELYREAQDAFNKALRLNPNNVDALYNKAKLLIATERYREAIGNIFYF